MRVTFVDDSVPFDAFTPASQALGGAERACVGLAKALSKRGHEVQVFTRARHSFSADGVRWEAWDALRPLETDVLIAHRKPSLLGAVRKTARRIYWFTHPARGLKAQSARKALDSLRPVLAFQGQAHKAAWDGKPALPALAVAPAAAKEYCDDAPPIAAAVPRAVVTTHPAHGLVELVALWVARIHPAAPEAELHVYSGALSRAQAGQASLSEELRPVMAATLAAQDKGVILCAPEGDAGMAENYRRARVHLYPGHADDMACHTLIDGQATGLPAVVRPLGAAAERIENGISGFVAPDDAALANLAIQFLTEDKLYRSFSEAARARRQNWDQAAQAFEAAFP